MLCHVAVVLFCCHILRVVIPLSIRYCVPSSAVGLSEIDVFSFDRFYHSGLNIVSTLDTSLKIICYLRLRFSLN